MFELIIPLFEGLGPLIILRSIDSLSIICILNKRKGHKLNDAQ